MQILKILETIEDAELYEAAYDLPPAMVSFDRVTHGDTLLTALETAALSYLRIPEEQAILRELLELETDPVKIKAREYQIWLVERQLTRASEVAKKRIEYLTEIKTQAQADVENHLCAKDKHHWFEYYAWGFDPRSDAPLAEIPIEPFDFQRRYLDWLDFLVFRTRQSGAVPKAREMGATEWALRWADYHWLYTGNFEALFLSRTETEVDSSEDLNTLFEKHRFQFRLTPAWMLPKGFNLSRDMPYMKIKNRVNGSTLLGRAPTENVGRQGRATVVIYDEKAFAPNGGYKQHTSLSQTTKSLIDISSVAGRQNKFADVITDGKTPKFEMDWREHPWKTEDWYNALPTGVFGVAMTTQQIAQEIDRDLDASQPGKVWKFREEYLFITQDKLVAAFEKFGFGEKFYDKAGKFVIPRDWNWSRYSDYGNSPGHDWSYLIAARPTEYYPLHDTVFVLLALNLEPNGLTEEQAVGLWRNYEQDLGLRNERYEFVTRPQASQNSHEQLDLRKTLLKEYGENWEPWNTDYISGIAQTQTWMTVIEDNLPNPYYPELFGRYRIVFVAPPGEYSLAFDEKNGAYFITNSKTELGFMTCRKQLPAYHYPETERGKPVKKQRPAKTFDDIVDDVRALATNWGPDAKKKTKQEEIESRTSPQLKQMEVAQYYGEEGFAELTIARIQEQRQIEMQIENEKKQEQQDLSRTLGGGRGLRLFGKKRR